MHDKNVMCHIQVKNALLTEIGAEKVSMARQESHVSQTSKNASILIGWCRKKISKESVKAIFAMGIKVSL